MEDVLFEKAQVTRKNEHKVDRSHEKIKYFWCIDETSGYGVSWPIEIQTATRISHIRDKWETRKVLRHGSRYHAFYQWKYVWKVECQERSLWHIWPFLWAAVLPGLCYRNKCQDSKFEMAHLLIKMRYFGPTAPHRTNLKDFGGNMSRKDFRNSGVGRLDPQSFKPEPFDNF